MEHSETLDSNPRPPMFKTAAENGAVISGVLIIYSMILYLLDFHTEQWLGSVGIVIMVILLFIFGQRYARSGGRTDFGYGRAFKFLISVVFISALISGVFNFIYFEFISPETIDLSIDQSYESMIEQGMSEEQAQQQMKFVLPWMNSWVFAGSGVFMTLLFGGIASLIFAALIKQESSSI